MKKLITILFLLPLLAVTQMPKVIPAISIEYGPLLEDTIWEGENPISIRSANLDELLSTKETTVYVYINADGSSRSADTIPNNTGIGCLCCGCGSAELSGWQAGVWGIIESAELYHRMSNETREAMRKFLIDSVWRKPSFFFYIPDTHMFNSNGYYSSKNVAFGDFCCRSFNGSYERAFNEYVTVFGVRANEKLLIGKGVLKEPYLHNKREFVYGVSIGYQTENKSK